MADNPMFRAQQYPADAKEKRLGPNVLLVQRRSPATGIVNQMELAITEAEWEAYQSGVFAQRAFPRLDATEREFLMSGYFGTEFEDTFKEED